MVSEILNFAEKLKGIAKETGCEIKEDGGMMLWPIYNDTGGLSEWYAIYVRNIPKTADVEHKEAETTYGTLA